MRSRISRGLYDDSNSRPLIPASLLALVASLIATPAAATLTAQLFYSSEILGIPTMSPSQQAEQGPLTDSFDFVDALDPLPNGEIRASTETDYGLFRLRALLDIEADDFDRASISLDSGTSARGSFTDLVTIDAPGRTGTQGSFVPLVDMSGFLDAEATGEDLPFVSFAESSVLLTLVPGSQQRVRTCSTQVGTGAACFIGDPLGVQVFDPVTFTFGTPFTLSLSADAGLFNRTVPNGTSRSEADFLLTVRWLGFEGVLDAAQSPVVDFTVSSVSGTDWSVAVPEPSRELAGLSALIASAALARRARRQRSPPEPSSSLIQRDRLGRDSANAIRSGEP